MQVVHAEVAVKKANELLREYEVEYVESITPNEVTNWEFPSFGDWVLQKYYPNVTSDSHPSIRDMCTTARTSDAKTWLIANFMNGRLALSK
jgi:hypothetical protein